MADLQPKIRTVRDPNRRTSYNSAQYQRISVESRLHPFIGSIVNKYPQLGEFFDVNLTSTLQYDYKHSIQTAVITITKSLNLVLSQENKLKDARQLVLNKIKNLAKKDNTDHDIKILLSLKYRQELKTFKSLVEKFQMDRIYIQCLTDIADFITNEKLPVEFNVNYPKINQNILKKLEFPILQKRKIILSQRIKTLSEIPRSTPSAILEKILSELDNHYDKDSGFVDDFCLKEFQIAIESMSANFNRLVDSTSAVIEQNPDNSGKQIIHLSQSLISIIKISHDNMLHFLFTLFSRLIFDRLYTQKFFLGFINVDFSFQIRIRKLKKRIPSSFPPCLPFFPNELHDIPIESFPTNHLYSESVKIMQFLQFETCPLDFCMSCYKCLNHIQQVASKMFESNSSDGTKLKEAFQLSFDQLFDVSLIIVLLASPIELRTITKQLAPYVKGLKISSQLEFGFTMIQSVCDHISSIQVE